MYILAMETSCDDTGAAVFADGTLLSNVNAGQLIHSEWGGVVPELASRAHQATLQKVVAKALGEAKVAKDQLGLVAYTQGPGLLGSLLVGQSFAKGLAMALDVPLLGVNHMQAHVMAHFIEAPMPKYPFLCLTVSGGHTQIVVVRAADDMETIGETRDDAAGEAFDKCGKILGLPYPAGPIIDARAQLGDASKYKLPKPAMEGLDFSFSGLKTAFLYMVQKMDDATKTAETNNLCASLQRTIVSALLEKVALAAEQTGIRQIAIAGGVSANSGLRQALREMAIMKGWETYAPSMAYCTDNAAMVGIAAYYMAQKGQRGHLADVPFVRNRPL